MQMQANSKHMCVKQRMTLANGVAKAPALHCACQPRPARARHLAASAIMRSKSSSAINQVAGNLVGAAVTLGMVLPGSATATLEPAAAPAAPLPPQEVAITAGLLQRQQDDGSQQQQGPLLSCYTMSSDLSEAPELVTDADVEAAADSSGGASSPFCLDTSALVNGLGWVVEGAQEVTNFTESNFAAVGAPSSSMWLSNSPWCMVWDSYCNLLSTRPVATKLATGMVGTFLGDMLAQFTQGLMNSHSSAVASSRRGGNSGSSGDRSGAAGSKGRTNGGFELDLTRTARLVGFSAVVGTPVAFVWFSLLDQYVLPTDPTCPLAVFSKVALDQVCMAPLMTSMFFAAMAFLEGCRSPKQVSELVKSKLKPTLLANWTVWPLAHVINFALVPPAQRILYINVVNIAWTAFMSHMASSSSAEDKAPAVQQQQQQHAPTRPKELQQAGR